MIGALLQSSMARLYICGRLTDRTLEEQSFLTGGERRKQNLIKMKKLILTLSFFCAFNVIAEDSQELKFLGKTIIHEDGSWVNPEEPECIRLSNFLLLLPK